MRTACRPQGKFYLLSLGIFCLSLPCVRKSAAQAVPAAPIGAPRSVAKLRYETLKARVMGNDLTVNWSEFRAAAAQSGLDSEDWHAARERVLRDLDAGKRQAALSGALTLIDHNMADPEGHLLAMTVYQQMGMESAAERERGLVDAIVKSIMISGNGQTAQHAWSTVSAGEEAFIVMMVLDADTESRTKVATRGILYDRTTVRGEDGGEHIFWFRVNPTEQLTVAAVVLPPR